MTLLKVLRKACRILDNGHESVVITRGHVTPEALGGRGSTFQIRLRHNGLHGDDGQLACETRSWLGEQWSKWYVRHGWLGGAGFDISDVLATDWRIS